MTSKNVVLSVNYIPINIEDFVQKFIESVIIGIISALKDYREAHDIKLTIDGDLVDITVDNNVIQINSFVTSFTKNTIIGMISALKDVGQIERLEIRIS